MSERFVPGQPVTYYDRKALVVGPDPARNGNVIIRGDGIRVPLWTNARGQIFHIVTVRPWELYRRSTPITIDGKDYSLEAVRERIRELEPLS